MRFTRNVMMNLMHLSSNVILVQRNAKSLTIQSILEANVQLTSSLSNSAGTAKDLGMKILDTPIDPDRSTLQA